MFSLLGKFIIYSYNDSSLGFMSGFYRMIGKEYLLENSTLTSLLKNKVDFLTSTAKQYLFSHFDFVIVNNILLILAVFLSIYFSFKLFNIVVKRALLSLFFTILYSFSTYFLYRVISATQTLYFIFVFPTVLYLLLKNKKSFFVGLIVFIFSMISNYYGFFLFVLVCFWYLSDLILKKVSFKNFLKNTILFFLSFTILIAIFIGPLLYKNLPIFGKYERSQESEFLETDTHSVYRPIDNWSWFSFRPWYFFIPPKSSVFFGEFSKNINKKIESTGYYLADDYMEEEMAGSYMGWHFLIGLGTVATLLLLKRYKNIEFKTFQNVYKNKEMIIRSFFIIFCILLISGPPSFTISGVEIYTPTYLLYYIVPVFRTLVRWAVVIYLFVLIINSFLVQDLYNLMKTKFQKILFILAFLSLNFVIFAIKIPVININKPPEEIAFVKEKYPESVPYAVYPKGDYYSIFWIISHEDLLINPVNFINYETGFNSNEFSKNLITEEGIQEFLNKDPKYLIYYPEKISDDDLEKIGEINPNLKTREYVYEFFRSQFGESIEVGESVVFEVTN
ncbi:hypothetical protein K0B04_03675 [Patescibacteria group bacterium]|nr:hypothetical protein [Patescibacteria group bacterium]